MKNKIKLLFLAFSMALFSGCYSDQIIVEKLITSPELKENQREILDELKRYSGENIVLKYPKSGENSSPFVMGDIDGDGEDEVIVTYFDNDDNNMKFVILDKKQNGKWNRVFSANGLGDDVEKIFLAEILDTKNKQIIVSWKKTGSVDCSLQIYNYKFGLFECIYETNDIFDMFMFDINNDQNDELIMVNKSLKVTPRLEVIFRSKDVSDLNVSYVRVASGSGPCQKITCGKLTNNVNAVFLDNLYPSNTDRCYTEVVASNISGELVNLFYDSKYSYEKNTALIDQTIRENGVFCRDIDNDGIIEVPRTLNPRHYLKHKRYKNIKPLILWQKYKDNTWTMCDLSVENIQDGYSFRIPSSLYNKNSLLGAAIDSITYEKSKTIDLVVFAVYDDLENSLVFKTNDEKAQEVLSIRIQKATEAIPNGYQKILRNNGFIYCVRINNISEKISLTLEEVKDCFSVIYGR